MRKSLVIIPIILGIMVGTLVLYHLINVKSMDSAWRMTRHDFTVMAKCPHKVGHWYRFLKRSELDLLEYNYGHLRIPDYAEVACTKDPGLPTRL